MRGDFDIQRDKRAGKVRFTGLPGGGELVVPPISLDQSIECLLLDPPPANLLTAQLRLRARLAALLGDTHETVAALDAAIALLRKLPAEQVSDFAEMPLEAGERLQRQFVVLFGEQHAHLTRELNQIQIGQMIGAVYVAGCGMDAELYALWQIMQRHQQEKLTTLAMIERLRTLTVEMAAHYKRFPDEVGAKPLADIIAVQEALGRQQREVAKWDAALHGVKLE